MAQLNGKDALSHLMEGNRRFVEGSSVRPNQTIERRIELVKGQAPEAIVVACSDSRVTPEILFDQGLGDIFVICIAGNVVDDMAIGSIEYAAAHLGTQLVMVLGHTGCGAVGATIAGGEAEGHIGSIVEAIRPAMEKAKDIGGDLEEETIKQNALMVAEKLRSSEPILKKLVNERKLLVQAAIYDIKTGIVNTIE